MGGTLLALLALRRDSHERLRTRGADDGSHTALPMMMMMMVVLIDRARMQRPAARKRRSA